MPVKTGRDPAQYGLFATPLEAMIAPDAEVRVIAAFVDQLNLLELDFQPINTMGASAYGPEVLLKIYLYGYLNRVRSSRRLARECRLNVEMMWLTGNLQPKQKTIAEFRRIHPKQLKKVFREYVLLLKEWELIGGKRIAVDGTKVHAQNARKKNFNDAKLKRHLDRIDNRIDEALEEFSRLDKYEDGEEKSELVARTQDAIDVLKARRTDYESLRKKLSESEDTQVSLTDPDARSLIKHGRESLVGYNVQSVVDDANKLIVHTEVTNENDLNALGQLVEDTHELLDLEAGTEVLADKGYHNATEMQRVRDLGHDTFVAERRHASSHSEDNYPPSHFCYDAGQDAYICPAGELLRSSGKLYRRKGTTHRFQTYRASRKVCGKCPLREQCLSVRSRASNHSRSINRLEHAAAVEANHDNLYNNPGVYQQRQAIVEHPFGTLKRQWTGYYTLLRGLDKVDGEFSLLACCYNIRRSMSIFGVLDLLERLKGCFPAILPFFVVRDSVVAGVSGVYCEGPRRLVLGSCFLGPGLRFGEGLITQTHVVCNRKKLPLKKKNMISKKELIIAVFLMATYSVFGQTAFHNSEIEIGDSRYDVKNNENGIILEEDYSELVYKKANVKNGIYAQITYKFKSDKLEEIKYRIYAPPYKKATCENYMNLRERVSYVGEMLSYYKDEGFKCQMGWHVLNRTHLATLTGNRGDYYNCGIGSEVELMDEESKKQNTERVSFSLDKDEYSVDFSFNLFYNYQTESQYSFDATHECNDEAYEILGWITLDK